MKNSLICIVIFALHFIGIAQQNTFSLTGNDSDFVEYFLTLEDKGYSFNQILNDETLPFIRRESLTSSKTDYYWIKIKVYNPSLYSEKYFVEFLPMLDNTLYYFNENQKNG